MPDKSIHAVALDEILKSVAGVLKPLGFKKKGRTFNREAERGLVQVINFQSGPLNLGYEIPGIRENLYGKFTINLGVLIKEIQIESYPDLLGKDFFSERYCNIRERLPKLLKGKDIWWESGASSAIIEVTSEVIEGLNTKGIPWFSLFETREKICLNWEKHGYCNKLILGLLILQTDRKKGEELIRDDINNTERLAKKDYMIQFVKKFGVII